MKWLSPLVFFTGVTAVLAAPGEAEIVKRATAGDTATIGYAAGTTGGSGGTTTTVTTLAALTSALAGDSKKIIIISGSYIYVSTPTVIYPLLILIFTLGTITGNTVVKVGSNTSVIGKSGACE